MGEQIQKDQIIEYYDKAQVSYEDVWHLNSALALHYGFWEKGVKNLKQALLKENQVVADTIDINKNDLVLDAGCGVGGSSIYLAKNIGCSVKGITLSPKQVDSALKNAQKHKVQDRVDFSIQDFHATDFPNDHFDKIWFMESFCHSNESERLLSEMYRVLKPGGQLVIADAFLTNELKSTKDQKVMDDWLNNWAVSFIVELNRMPEYLTKTGFKEVVEKNYTQQIYKSARLLYFYAQLALLYGGIKRFFGGKYGNQVTIKNTYGAKYQFLALKRKLWSYHVISCRKEG